MKEPTIEELMAADVTGNAEKFTDAASLHSTTGKPTAASEVTDKSATLVKEEPDAQPADVYSIHKDVTPKPSRKGKKFNLELTAFEYDQAKRAADAVGVEVKEWLLSQVTAQLTSNIGRAKIFGPTGTTTSKVTGPSVGVAW